MKYEEDMTRWSNAKKARLFMHIIAYLAIRENGEVKLPLKDLEEMEVSLGMVVDDGELVIAVNMDNAPPWWKKSETLYALYVRHPDEDNDGVVGLYDDPEKADDDRDECAKRWPDNRYYVSKFSPNVCELLNDA